jgi:hypothetical protein
MANYSWPVGASEEERRSPNFPPRWLVTNPYANSYWLGTHTGVDLDLPSNEDALLPVYAVADGKVVYARLVIKADGKPSTWGKLIVIRHGDFCSRYGHLDSIKVDEGQEVKAGDVIGRIGRTGGDAGSQRFSEHLHFDIAGMIIGTPSSAPYWPTSRADVLRHFYDPIEFMKLRMRVEEPAVAPVMVVVVAENGLNVRSTPGGTRIGAMVKGTLLTIDLDKLTKKAMGGVTYDWVPVVWTQNPAYVAGWVAYGPTFLALKEENEPVKEKMVVSTARLNVRSAPSTLAPTLLPQLTSGQVVEVAEKQTANGYVWRNLVNRAGVVAQQRLSPVELYLKPYTEPTTPPPTGRRRLAGYHGVQSGLPANEFIEIAKIDKRVTFVINNDWELCNRLADMGCMNIICRIVDTAYDPFPILTGNADEDRNRGYDYFFNAVTGSGRNKWGLFKNLRPSVKLQYINEWQHPNDGPFTEGLIMAADSVNRQTVNFNDAVGNPHMWREAVSPLTGATVRSDAHPGEEEVMLLATNGVWRSPQFEQRKEALRLCIQWPDGTPRQEEDLHFFGYHSYGASPHRFMVDPGDWPWYAGRFEGLLSTVPYKPPTYFTECGPFDATNPGVGHVMQDIETFEAKLQQYPYVRGFAYWTAGVWSVTGQGVNDSIPAFKDYLRRTL